MKVGKRDALLPFSIWLFTMLAMGETGLVLMVIRVEGLMLFMPMAFIGLLGGFWMAVTFNKKHGLATIIQMGIIATVLMLGSFFAFFSILLLWMRDHLS